MAGAPLRAAATAPSVCGVWTTARKCGDWKGTTTGFSPSVTRRNDGGTVPGEEHHLAELQAEDRARFRQVNATTHYHGLQIQDFLRAVLEERPPLVTGEDGRTIVAMFTAICRSQRERRPIKFPPPSEE
jgi:predicted dehydrogenase